MLSQRLAGIDGLGPADFTLPALQQAMLGDRDNSAELDLADTVAMCRAHPELPATNGQMTGVAAACEVLAVAAFIAAGAGIPPPRPARW
jgi:acyl-homoserine-lactone acylase